MILKLFPWNYDVFFSLFFFNTDKEGCLNWYLSIPVKNVKVIDVTEVNRTHTFVRDPDSPCQLTPYIAYLDVTGNWKNFSLSANVLKVEIGDLNFKDSNIMV